MTNVFVALHRQDERILHFLVARRGRVLDGVMRLATHCGDAAVTIGLALLLLAGPGTRETGALAAIALAASHLGVQILKRTVNRARPRLPAGVEALMQAPDRFSFPSGHAAASLSLALAISPGLAWPLGLAVLGLSLLTGVSRCYLGVHYPGDVVVGWTLAGAGWQIGLLLV
jgi:undecaprenyl-diphosphatase